MFKKNYSIMYPSIAVRTIFGAKKPTAVAHKGGTRGHPDEG